MLSQFIVQFMMEVADDDHWRKVYPVMRCPSIGDDMALKPNLRVENNIPKLKFFLQILAYFIYITSRNVFLSLQGLWWRLTGTSKTLRTIRQGGLYKKCAHVQKVVWRGKADLLCITRNKDFIGVHEMFDDPRRILQDHVTLHSISHDDVTFVETPPEMDIHNSEHAPFLYLAQYHQAVRTITLPHWAFIKLADEIGDPETEVTILPNTGRCGSTILTQMFEACPHGVQSISEPDVITNFDVLKSEFEPEVYQRLFQSTIRLLCKPIMSRDVRYVLLKTRSTSIRHVPTIHELFPKIHLLFMYRDRMETVRSMDQAFSGLLTFWSVHIFLTWPSLRWLFPGVTARCRYYCLGDDVSTAWMRKSHPLNDSLTIFYYMCMHHIWIISKYLDYQREGLPIPAIKYDDIVKDREHSCRVIFRHCGLPVEFVSEAVEALKRDSQRSSPLARGAKEHRKRQDVVLEVLELCDEFCRLTGIPQFSEDLDLPQTITAEKK